MKQHVRQCTAVLCLLLTANGAWTQERALAYRYAMGQETKYQRTIRLQAESAANPEGKEDAVFMQTYILRVEAVQGDGSARMVLRLDSAVLWQQGKLVDLPPADTLRNVSVQFLSLT